MRSGVLARLMTWQSNGKAPPAALCPTIPEDIALSVRLYRYGLRPAASRPI